MTARVSWRRCALSLAVSFGALCVARGAVAAPVYNIVDLGVVNSGDFSQGLRISPNGIATGRNITFNSNSVAYTWTQNGGLVALPNYVTSSPSRPYGRGNGVNNAGTVVGSVATTLSGTNPVPVMWQGGVPSAVPLPAGQTFGTANDVNSTNTIVGSVNGGSAQIAFMSKNGASTQINTLTPGGAYAVTLFSINDAGIAVGQGVDPNNAARNVPFVYDTVHDTASEVSALPGYNGGIAFDASESGSIVGVDTQNQGSGPAFFWSQATGTVAIPLVAGTSSNQANGVNSSGLVVGNAGGAFSVPWLWDGTQSYRLQDLIPSNSGWDLSQNTSNSAESISENGIIVGTGMIGGQIHSYAMIPAPEPSSLAALAATGLLALRRRSRRVAKAARSKSGLAIASATLAAAAAGTASARTLMFDTIIRSSDAVPGVAGATWNTTSNSFFAAPSIDNSGNVVFRGQMTAGVGGVQSTPPANQAGYWYGAPGSLSLFARDGTAGPTMANPNNWVHNTTSGAAGLSTSSPPISPNGTMMAGSSLNGTGVTSATSTAVWTGSYTNMQVVAQQGTTSPAGTVHDVWSSSMATLPLLSSWINNNGQILIGSNLASDGNAGTDIVTGNSTTSNDSGVWVASPSGSTLVARENAPTAITGTQYGELGTAGFTAAMNGSGQMAMVSSLRAGVGGVVGTGSTGRNDSVVWTTATPGGALSPVARKSDPVPGLSGVNYFGGSALAFFLGSQPLNNSGRMIFDAQFDAGWTSGSANEAIMTSRNGSTNVLVRSNDPAAGVSGALWDNFNTTNCKARINNDNSVLFTGQMRNTAGGTTDDEGIWMTHVDGNGSASNTQLIAREGQAIPNASGLSLGSGLVASSTPLLNNADQVVFLDNVIGAGVDATNDSALFAWTPADGLEMLLREGDSAATSINGLSGIIGNNTTSINPFSYAGQGNGEGGNGAFSDTGWLTLAVTLRTAGINDINLVRVQIPEPASLGLLGLAPMLYRRRRSR